MTGEFVLIVLSVAAVAVLLACAVLLFRKPFSPGQWILFYVNLLLVRVLWRAEIPKHFPVPEGQGVLVVCNHRSSIDPCVIQVAARKRIVHWMVAQLYGEGTFISGLLKMLEVIPVHRKGNDVSATKAAIRLAADGELVGMFPEGTVNRTDQFMRPVPAGAVLVALKARVPILPCYIEGSPYHDVPWRPVFMRARIRLKIGELLDISQYYDREGDKSVLAKLTLDCVREIAKLADQSDFEPEMAGRDWKTWQH